MNKIIHWTSAVFSHIALKWERFAYIIVVMDRLFRSQNVLTRRPPIMFVFVCNVVFIGYFWALIFYSYAFDQLESLFPYMFPEIGLS